MDRRLRFSRTKPQARKSPHNVGMPAAVNKSQTGIVTIDMANPFHFIGRISKFTC